MRKAVAVPTEPYPTSGLVAKHEAQVTSFLQKHPEYDGRGMRVAILDSGVDPATFGLTGKNKLVDIIDCTGAKTPQASHLSQADSSLLSRYRHWRCPTEASSAITCGRGGRW